MKIKSKVTSKDKKSTLEKVMGVSIILVLTLLVVGCPSSGSSPDPTTTAGAGMCANGTPTSSTTDDATFCENCNTGFTLSNNSCIAASAGMCANGTPTSSTTDDATFCENCNTGFTLSNNSCVSSATLDTDGDSVLDINELPSCVNNADCDDDMVADNMDVDDDNDGLIEIRDLTELHNMRWNLAGTSYDDEEADSGGTADVGITTGGPASRTTNCSTINNGVYLCGYELVRSLDFDGSDADTTTWTSSTDGSGVTTYTLDADDNNATYFPTSSGGWLPIGDHSNLFTGIFEGNGFTISNLAISRGLNFMGFFSGCDEYIRNIGLINVLVNSTQTSFFTTAGGLVGQSSCSISSSYVTRGTVNGGAGNDNHVGGLVGRVSSSSVDIYSSYATVTVNGRAGTDNVGGLVGRTAGRIRSSYATGTVNGGDGNDDVGGLVGMKETSVSIISSSYATGSVDGGAGTDNVGSLVGLQSAGSITVSYGFGTAMGVTANMLGAPPSGVTTASGLTLANAGTQWNTTANSSSGAWDFGTTSQAPALNYADYDGAGNTFACSNAANPPNNAILIANCGTLLMGQR